MDRDKKKYISIGKIIGSHGVHGFTKVFPLTDFPERFEKVKNVLLYKDEGTQLKAKIDKVRFTHNSILVKFDAFDTPEAVNEFKGYFIKIPQSESLELPEDSFYIDDLKGCETYSTENEYLGKIIEVYTSANTLIEIKTPDRKDVMVPFVKEMISEIDLKNKRVTIKVIPGLFDEPEE